MRRLLGVVAVIALATPALAQDGLRLFAAGSLRAALTELAAAYGQTYGAEVETAFGASGLMRERIEGGDVPDVFASANMAHPEALAAAGMGGPVVLFARNRLCALARPDLAPTPATLLDAMLDPAVRVGTSTPGADPSGDYAWALFERADAVRPGAFATLDAKALQLTGGPDSPKPPDGRNNYAWVMDEGRADLFLTYCTNARLARAESPALHEIAIPEDLAVGADYGLIVLAPDRPEAWRLAAFVLAAEGQGILESYGFSAGGLPAESGSK